MIELHLPAWKIAKIRAQAEAEGIPLEHLPEMVALPEMVTSNHTVYPPPAPPRPNRHFRRHPR